MYISTALLFLAASSARATVILAQRAPVSNLNARDVSQGWSLQSSSALTDLHSCGAGAYCPISLHCNSQVNNHQVVACCSDTSDCRGAVEGSPQCADSSWNLWVGYDGNGFCCQSGLVGAYDISQSVAGQCVSSNNIGSLRTAVLTSTGSGGQSTAAASSTASSAAASTTGTSTGTTTSTGSSTTSTGTSTSTSTGSSSSSGSSTGSSSSTATTAAPVSSTGNSTSSATSSSSSAKATANSAHSTAQGLGLMGAIFFAIAAF